MSAMLKIPLILPYLLIFLRADSRLTRFRSEFDGRFTDINPASRTTLGKINEKSKCMFQSRIGDD